MKTNHWVKTLDQTFSYMEWGSIRHSLRTSWKPLHHSNTAYVADFNENHLDALTAELKRIGELS